MANYETVTVERKGAVAIITLNRPEALNAFSPAQSRDTLNAAREVNSDDSVRAVILAGAGRSFGAGVDLSGVSDGDSLQRADDTLNIQFKPVIMEIYRAPKLWISAVQGAAAGISSAFAMVCDLTVMGEDAYIYQAFTAISLIPDGGATWHLVRTLGRKRAYEVIVTGEKLPAEKCLEWGLCNRVVPTEQLMSETLQWAEELATRAPLSLRYAKQVVADAAEEDFPRTMAIEADLQLICSESEDAKEGVTAFFEKRPPVWKGC